jgi:uncharacterized membrane protein YphA (DoxX/SURF4 family)
MKGMSMDKQKVLRIVGVVATVVGGAALYLGGATESAASALVGGVFLVAAMVAGIVRS